MAQNNFQGLNQLIRQLKNLSDKVEEVAEFIAEETANKIAADARELAPVQTGKLRDSIQVEKEVKVFIIGTDLTYAPGVELGLKGSEAKPFLFPAYEANRKEFINNLKAAIKLI